MFDENSKNNYEKLIVLLTDFLKNNNLDWKDLDLVVVPWNPSININNVSGCECLGRRTRLD